jgi:arabinogalactan oligomer/maltooligosaccharide transport system substrate-binding protein
MYRRSLWLTIIGLAVVSLALGACTQPTPPAEKVTVTLWHAYQTGSAEEDTLTALIEKARAEFPDMEIEVLQIPFDQVFNKWETEVAAGGGPTMFVAPNDSLGDEARASLLAPLDTYLEGKLGGVNDNGVEGMKVDGVLYGVPESAKAVALYYNKSMVETPPATTAELLAAVEGGAPMTFFVGAYHMFGWSGAFGGQLMDDEGRCIADQGGWVEALDYLLALKEAGATFTTDYGQAEGPFRNGETAFFVNGPWALADYKADLGDDLGVAVMPAGTAPANPLNGIDGFYVNPNVSDAEKQAAVDLGLFLSSGDSAQTYTDMAGHVPIRDSVDASDPLVAVFAQASAQGFPRPQSTFFSNYWTPFGDMFTQAIEGVSTPEEAVDEACGAMNSANGF